MSKVPVLRLGFVIVSIFAIGTSALAKPQIGVANDEPSRMAAARLIADDFRPLGVWSPDIDDVVPDWTKFYSQSSTTPLKYLDGSEVTFNNSTVNFTLGKKIYSCDVAWAHGESEYQFIVELYSCVDTVRAKWDAGVRKSAKFVPALDRMATVVTVPGIR